MSVKIKSRPALTELFNAAIERIHCYRAAVSIFEYPSMFDVCLKIIQDNEISSSFYNSRTDARFPLTLKQTHSNYVANVEQTNLIRMSIILELQCK